MIKIRRYYQRTCSFFDDIRLRWIAEQASMPRVVRGDRSLGQIASHTDRRNKQRQSYQYPDINLV